MQSLTINLPTNFSIKINPAIIKIGLIVLILFSVGFYLFQIGEFTRSSYLIKNHSQEIVRASGENIGLVTRSTESISLETVEQKMSRLGFVKVQTIKYLPLEDRYLTRKNP